MFFGDVSMRKFFDAEPLEKVENLIFDETILVEKGENPLVEKVEIVSNKFRQIEVRIVKKNCSIVELQRNSFRTVFNRNDRDRSEFFDEIALFDGRNHFQKFRQTEKPTRQNFFGEIESFLLENGATNLRQIAKIESPNAELDENFLESLKIFLDRMKTQSLKNFFVRNDLPKRIVEKNAARRSFDEIFRRNRNEFFLSKFVENFLTNRVEKFRTEN